MNLPGTYVLRRVLIAVPSLLGISIILFTALALAPGDPFGDIVSNPNIPADTAANLRKTFGMDDPVYLRYWHWLTAMLQGDWGFSFASRIDVDTLIIQRLWTTLMVIGSSQVLALLIALPVGIYAATRPYSLFDQVANTLTFIGFSLPTFFTGLLLILVFSIQLDWLPFVYRSDITATSTGCRLSTGPTLLPPDGDSIGNISGRRSCRSACWHCSRRHRGRAMCARLRST